MAFIIKYMKKSDDLLYYLFNVKLRTSWMDLIMVMITTVFNPVPSIILSLLLFGIGQYQGAVWGRNLLFLLATTSLIVHLIKHLAMRARPFETLSFSRFNFPKPKDIYSFPSGHTAAAFTFALVLGSAFPSLRDLWMVLASLVGVSRVYLGYHYPTDIVAGTILPLIISRVLYIVNLLQ